MGRGLYDRKGSIGMEAGLVCLGEMPLGPALRGETARGLGMTAEDSVKYQSHCGLVRSWVVVQRMDWKSMEEIQVSKNLLNWQSMKSCRILNCMAARQFDHLCMVSMGKEVVVVRLMHNLA